MPYYRSQMSTDYRFHQSTAKKFNNLCYDLLTRRRFHDPRTFTILVVDKVFNSADIDLCEIPAKEVDFVKFDCLLGHNSEVFKSSCNDDVLYRNLLRALINHFKRSRISIPAFYHSVYFQYFNYVLTYLLPANDNILLSLKKFEWFNAINKHSAAKSALRLLKPQVIAASYSPDLFTPTDGFSSFYHGHVKELQATMDSLTKKLSGRNPSNSSVNTSLNITNGSSSSISSFNPHFTSTPNRLASENRIGPVTKLYYFTSHGCKQGFQRQGGLDFSKLFLPLFFIFCFFVVYSCFYY